MTGTSKIEWTEHTWNPVVGCSIVSPGCTNCYAMQMASRIEAMGNQPRYAGTTKKVNGHAVWTGKLAQAPESVLLAPLKRKKPTTYFVNSMGDLFHEDVPDEWIDKVFAVMALCPQHTFQVLTKRAERMRDYFAERLRRGSDGVIEAGAPRAAPLRAWFAACALVETYRLEQFVGIQPGRFDPPLRNVWLGVSAERQQEADERIPRLVETPAAVRFVSIEPLLGPVNLFDFIGPWGPTPQALQAPPQLDWVIVGGESGPEARSMHPAWARSLHNQCAAAGVRFFFKQWGAWAPSTPEHAKGNPRSGWQALAGHPHVAKSSELYPEAGAEFVEFVGKKAAGRLLDGIEHNAMPERSA